MTTVFRSLTQPKEIPVPKTSPNRPKVIVTGSSGLIGSMLIRSLAGRYTFSGIDKIQYPHGQGVHTTTADMSNLDTVAQAFSGHEIAIHLAAEVSETAPWNSILPNNIIATQNVFEAARQVGIRRVVIASSNHSTGMYEFEQPYVRIRSGDYLGIQPATFPMIDHTVPIRPDGLYGVSKLFGEATGRYYSDNFGLEVACIRIGTVNQHNNPTQHIRHFATWCSHQDLAQLVGLCLSHQPLKFDIFYGVSDNTWRFWDISHASEVLGYRPLDNAEEFRGQENFQV